MSNINKIKVSGTTYNIQDENACKVVELTQAQYDDLPTTAKTSNSLFVITDATAGDLSNYYTKSETSGATEISTALESKADTATTYTKTETDNAITAATSTKQDTLVSGTNIKTINNQSILGEGNITIEGGSGGGKAIEAGRGISITTGETADTVSFNLPVSAGTGTDSVLLSNGSSANGNQSCAGGQWCTANGRASFAFGNQCHADFRSSAAFGVSCSVDSQYSFVCGERNTAKGDGSFACGQNNITNGDGSFACGRNSIFRTGSTDADNTLFSVGNGTSMSVRHNAFEIRQNGDIYISKDGQDVKLQDQLGGGGGSSYTAGDGIDITNDVISVTGKVDTSTYNTYTAATDTALASKQTTLTAGTGISIVDNVISATGGGGGGSITIDPSLDSGSTNPVANSAITNAINSKMDEVNFASFYGNQYSAGLKGYYYDSQTETQTEKFNWGMVWQSDGSIGFDSLGNLAVFNKLDTSAITTSISSSSTDSQVPSAKAVYDIVGNIETLLSKI